MGGAIPPWLGTEHRFPVIKRIPLWISHFLLDWMEQLPYQSQPPCRGGRAKLMICSSVTKSWLPHIIWAVQSACGVGVFDWEVVRKRWVIWYGCAQLFGRDELFDMIVLPLVYLLLIKLNEEPTRDSLLCATIHCSTLLSISHHTSDIIYCLFVGCCSYIVVSCTSSPTHPLYL